MPITGSDNRGSQLLRIWQGDLLGKDAADALEIDVVTYSRLRNGQRKPTSEMAYRIEQLTGGVVKCQSWHESPIAGRCSQCGAPMKRVASMAGRKPSRLIRKAAAR